MLDTLDKLSANSLQSFVDSLDATAPSERQSLDGASLEIPFAEQYSVAIS